MSMMHLWLLVGSIAVVLLVLALFFGQTLWAMCQENRRHKQKAETRAAFIRLKNFLKNKTIMTHWDFDTVRTAYMNRGNEDCVDLGASNWTEVGDVLSACECLEQTRCLIKDLANGHCSREPVGITDWIINDLGKIGWMLADLHFEEQEIRRAEHRLAVKSLDRIIVLMASGLGSVSVYAGMINAHPERLALVGEIDPMLMRRLGESLKKTSDDLGFIQGMYSGAASPVSSESADAVPAEAEAQSAGQPTCPPDDLPAGPGLSPRERTQNFFSKSLSC